MAGYFPGAIMELLMKKLYSLVVLVALGALSGCVYHDRDYHHRDGHRPPPQHHHGDYDRGDRGDRDYRHHR